MDFCSRYKSVEKDLALKRSHRDTFMTEYLPEEVPLNILHKGKHVYCSVQCGGWPQISEPCKTKQSKYTYMCGFTNKQKSVWMWYQINKCIRQVRYRRDSQKKEKTKHLSALGK